MVCVSGEFIYRTNEELRLKFYDPGNETILDPIELRRRDETKLRRVKTMSLKISTMTCGPKQKVSIFQRSGLGVQDSRSYVQDLLKKNKW